MLVNCPKCGFSQPQDKYCAKCGVDMETFRPKGPSFFVRFWGNIAVQLVIVFLTVATAVFFIHQHAKQGTEDQGELIARPTQTSTVPGNKVTNPQLKNLPPPPPVPTENGSGSNPPPSNSAGTNNPPAAKGGDNNRGTTVKVRVILAEVDDLTLKKWASEVQPPGVFVDGEWKMLMVPKIEQKINDDRSIISMETSTKTFDGNRLSADWFSGKSSESGDWGIHYAANFTEFDPSMVRGEFHITAQTEASGPKQNDIDIEVPPKGGWVIWNVLNKKTDAPKELLDDTRSFFHIFKSERFKGGRSDFTIFLIFDTDSGS